MAPKSSRPERDPLSKYRDMRRFDETPEPAGGEVPAPAAAADADGEGAGDRLRFVIQQHDATRLHWDLRLEHEGVLASWAVPRGLPWNPKQDHLAVHTEDHPIEYLTFSGDIPKGSYGAGHMVIWDAGWYEQHEFTDRKAVVTLHGERVRGKYALFSTRGRDWMIHRMDPPEDPGRRAMPVGWRPMRASEGPLPTGNDWSFEVRWSGQRCLVWSSGGIVEIHDDQDRDVTRFFPELRQLGRALGITEVVLDGVVTHPDAGRASTLIERRHAARSDSTWRRHARDEPLSLVLFDLLWLDGYSLLDQPWSARRDALDGLDLNDDRWSTPSAHRGDGKALADQAASIGLRGLVAKRAGSRYQVGEVTDEWREVALG